MTKRGRWAVMVLCTALVATACSGDDDDGNRTTGSTTPDQTTPFVTTPNGEPVREGEFEKVADGDDGGLTWTLLSAPAAAGGVCWKLETEPEVDLVLEPEHCTSPLPLSQPVAQRIDFPYAGSTKTDHDIVVASVPSTIERAEFGFSDGTTAEPSYLDAEGGIVVWSGPSRPAAAAVTMTLEDKLIVDCGPGDITTALELYNATDAKLREARQFVWTCLERL
jgi:hypothetical protein